MMYQISFSPTSNRADWVFTGQANDASDGSLLDLSALTLVFAVYDEFGCQKLLATTGNGKMTIVGLGLFRWEFSKSEMEALCAGTYNTGMTMANVDQTSQLSVGPLPVYEGNVPA